MTILIKELLTLNEAKGASEFVWTKAEPVPSLNKVFNTSEVFYTRGLSNPNNESARKSFYRLCNSLRKKGKLIKKGEFGGEEAYVCTLPNKKKVVISAERQSMTDWGLPTMFSTEKYTHNEVLDFEEKVN